MRTTTLHTLCVLFWFPWEIDRLFAYALPSFLFSVGDQEGHSSKRITLGPNAQVTHWSASLLQRFMGIHLVFTALRSISFSPILRSLKMNRCNLKFHKLSYRVIYQSIEQTGTRRGGFPAIILAKKDKISGISNPKLTLSRAGNTLNLVFLEGTWLLHYWWTAWYDNMKVKSVV